jgi:hypothetical protein
MAMRPTINRHKIKLDEYAFALALAHLDNASCVSRALTVALLSPLVQRLNHRIYF